MKLFSKILSFICPAGWQDEWGFHFGVPLSIILVFLCGCQDGQIKTIDGTLDRHYTGVQTSISPPLPPQMKSKIQRTEARTVSQSTQTWSIVPSHVEGDDLVIDGTNDLQQRFFRVRMER